MLLILAAAGYLAAGLALVRWLPVDLRGDDDFERAATILIGPLFFMVLSPLLALGRLAKAVQK
ncbi:hypothetical protein [Streptomyces chryseus]|uniref:hypothetical protein n=1 Tax=Streptomyces chryseus TaxID=68186 RepID=UPI00110F9184|nr:hypothetical protein [Streptomyces chryseus]GGX26795.1 hypothetical protein GCM10010353_47410 [Streptomyces chryseus]